MKPEPRPAVPLPRPVARPQRAVALARRAAHPSSKTEALNRKSARSRNRFLFWFPILLALAVGAFFFVKSGGVDQIPFAGGLHRAAPAPPEPIESDAPAAAIAQPRAVAPAVAPAAAPSARRQAMTAPPAPIPAAPPATAAAMVQSDNFPGIPPLSLSAAVKAGDPDRQQLLFAAQWAASTGNWTRYFTALKDAIAAAAGTGPWQQRPYNIERLLALPTPVLAVEQAKFIRAVGSGTLTSFGRDGASKDFLNWLFARPQVLAAFSETIQPQDNASNALLQWRTIWSDDVENRGKLSSLAIACALVFDEPIKINPNIYGFSEEYVGGGETRRTATGPTEASAMARYRFYRDSAKKGSLKVSLDEMTPWELVWVVDAPVPESELIWRRNT